MRQELEFHAAGFAVRTGCRWTAATRAQLRRFVTARGLTPSEDELTRAIEHATRDYWHGPSALYVCAADPCAGASGLAHLSGRAGLTVATTGCQGHCKQAPVVALRIGAESQMFGRMIGADDWRVVFDFVRSAVAAGSFLAAGDDAQSFRFDPVHGHAEPAAQLLAARFLIGRFRGQGRFVASGDVFHKEVVGAYEAGGRFISLRMQARYPLPEGGSDVHRALIVLGADGHGGRLLGRAFTDGGDLHDYVVERRESRLEFDDRPPDHDRQWRRVRKTLRPTADGYEERLEVDGGRGLETYLVVHMRPIAG
jgi:hypothetical protein